MEYKSDKAHSEHDGEEEPLQECQRIAASGNPRGQNRFFPFFFTFFSFEKSKYVELVSCPPPALEPSEKDITRARGGA